MKPADVVLLLKKITVGIAITLVPLVIVAGSLWTIKKVHTSNTPTKSTSSAKVTYAN